MDKNFSQGNYDVAAQWCKLAGHQILSNAGETNVGKIERYGSQDSPDSLQC